MKYSFLPYDEFTEAYQASNKHKLILGGVINYSDKKINFLLGNLNWISVPFSIFQPCGDGTIPNFNDFSILDYGQSVRFGEYEASTDAILVDYEELVPEIGY